jgi:hypothetical protein
MEGAFFWGSSVTCIWVSKIFIRTWVVDVWKRKLLKKATLFQDIFMYFFDESLSDQPTIEDEVIYGEIECVWLSDDCLARVGTSIQLVTQGDQRISGD